MQHKSPIKTFSSSIYDKMLLLTSLKSEVGVIDKLNDKYKCYTYKYIFLNLITKIKIRYKLLNNKYNYNQ